jgi:hypothetical protein
MVAFRPPILSGGKGGRRDSNPQQPEPQSGALPLSYGHRESRNLNFTFRIANVNGGTRLSFGKG